MDRMKRLFAFISAVVMLFSICSLPISSATAYCAEGQKAIIAGDYMQNVMRDETDDTSDIGVNEVYDDLRYSIENGEVTVIGYTRMSEEELVIPSLIEGYPVTAIGDQAFENCSEIRKVTMPMVRKIGAFAFYGCGNLEEVIMHAVTTIDTEAFAGCSVLSKIDIGENVTRVGARAFVDTAYYNDSSNWVNGVLVLDYCLLDARSNEIPAKNTIHESIRVIADYAFTQCNTLTAVDMPTVAAIGYGAFSECKALVSLDMSVVTLMGTQAFAGCNELTNAYFFSDAPVSFAGNAFDKCAPSFSIYYAKETNGWTSPTWNGYPTQEFIPGSRFKVTFIDAVTEDIIYVSWIEAGKDAIFPAPPEHEGYVFTGWDSDGKNITADTAITALYDKNSFTVTFIDGYTGNTISEVSVKNGEDATFPTPPEHEGYIFTGWDSDGKNITADMTITALYERSFIIGDVNGDDEVNTGDAVMILQYSIGLKDLTEVRKLAADCNQDMEINTGDAIAVLQLCVNPDNGRTVSLFRLPTCQRRITSM